MPDHPGAEALAAAVAGAPAESPIQGPVHDPATGEITHLGLHGTKVVHHGGRVETITHGESFTPARDGAPAVVMRHRVGGA